MVDKKIKVTYLFIYSPSSRSCYLLSVENNNFLWNTK